MEPPNVPLVVVDTNVYVSGTIATSSLPGKILQAIQNNMMTLALSEPILEEIKEVLARPYFIRRLKWTREELDQYIDDLRLVAVVVPGTTPVTFCRDPKDNMILSAALEAGADFIVSGDQNVTVLGQFRTIPILTPREFVKKMLSGTSGQ